jgi:hypothetical protein
LANEVERVLQESLKIGGKFNLSQSSNSRIGKEININATDSQNKFIDFINNHFGATMKTFNLDSKTMKFDKLKDSKDQKLTKENGKDIIMDILLTGLVKVPKKIEAGQ